jgi:hypothetical protein
LEPQIRTVSLAELRGLRVPGVTIPLPSEPIPEPRPPTRDPKKLAGNMVPGRDLTGCRFGALIVLARAEPGYLTCRCDCGKSTVVARGSLLSNNTRSCGQCHAFGPRGGGRRVRPEPEALIECRAAWEAAAIGTVCLCAFISLQPKRALMIGICLVSHAVPRSPGLKALKSRKTPRTPTCVGSQL